VGGHVFISYSRNDRDYVERLASFLDRQGLVVWYDYEIETGDSFGPRIKAAIGECAVFVPVLTPAAASSKWVIREIGYADSRNKPIMPLLLTACDKPIEVSLLQHEDVTDGAMPSTRFVERLRVGAPAPISAVAKLVPVPRTLPAIVREYDDAAQFWSDVAVSPVRIALPAGAGFTLRAYRTAHDEEVPVFLSVDGRLPLFQEQHSLVRFVRSARIHALIELDSWPTIVGSLRPEHVDPAEDDIYELDLVVANLRAGPDAWLGPLLIMAGELARDLSFALKLAPLQAALAPGTLLDDFDEALRVVEAGGLSAIRQRRQLRRTDSGDVLRAWRTAIGAIAAAVDWHD
jgi:hypothetical protein